VIVPVAARTDAFADDLLGPALRLLADAVRGLATAVDPAPFNAWLHDGEDWHVEFLPRLTVLAGLELGAGVYINPVPPEEAAQDLQRALTGGAPPPSLPKPEKP
jgi:UDPglucose--hexose-1-phosphate uridylyltransferase